MASTITAGNATNGLAVSCDNTGILELKTGTGSGTTAVTIGTGQSATFAQAANLPNTFGFKNRIINGAMVIDQRNAGASVTPTTNQTYTVDRWKAAISQASKFSVQQSSIAPTGFNKSTLVTSLSAYTVGASEVFQLVQAVEGVNVADFSWGISAGTTCTLSFLVRSSLTGTFGGSLTNGNGAATASYPFSYTISAANTWEQKSVIIESPTIGSWNTNTSTAFNLRISLGTGSTYQGTAGSWVASDKESVTGETQVVATNGATFFITGVQLEKGSTATSFDFRPHGTELALCQRYYETTYPPGTAVGSVHSGPVNFRAPTTSSSIISCCSYKATKRTSPTITFWNGAAGTSGTWRGSSGANRTMSVTFASENGFGAIGGSSDDFMQQGHWEASAEL